MQKGVPLQNSQNWPFFGPILKDYKIRNTIRILASLVWMDAEFILVSINTKFSMKQKE